MEGGRDAFRFQFTSDFTASLDTFAFQTGSSGSVINFEMVDTGDLSSIFSQTFETDGATEVFGTFAPGTYDFFVDGSSGTGNAVDYDLTFAAVPLPAAGWALITALGMFAIVGRLRRKTT